MLPTFRPVLNIYLLQIPDIKAEVIEVPEKNARVKTGFPEALQAETLAACFIWIFLHSMVGYLIKSA